MFCTKCGKQIENDALYCNYCGHKIEKAEQEAKEKAEQEAEEKAEQEDDNGAIDIPKTLKGLYLLLLIIGTIAALANIVKFLIRKGDAFDILGQVIFFLIFLVSTILLLKSKKIGGSIIISFVLFKMISSLYYYKIHYEYFAKNLIIDEIFYLAIISLSIINWKTLK